MLFDQLYSRRGVLASLPSLVVMLLALFWASRTLTPAQPATQTQPSIALRMAELPPPPQPPKIAPPPRQTAPPKPAPALAPAKPMPVVPERSAAVVATPALPSPPLPAPVSTPAPTPAPVAVARPESKPAPAPTPAPPPASVPSASIEASYIARLRAQLDSSKRYPTGREASLMRPAGMVRIWLVLDRSGRLLDSGVDKSSESMLLDHAALSGVRRGEYPAFPAETWAGAASHRFTVDLNYTPAN